MEQKALIGLKQDWDNKLSRLIGFLQLLAGIFIAQIYHAVNADGKHTLLGWLFLAAAIVFVWIFFDVGTLFKRIVDVFIDIRLHQIDQSKIGKGSHADSETISNDQTLNNGKRRMDKGCAEIKSDNHEKKPVKLYTAEYWRRHLISHLRYDPSTSLEEALLRHSKEVT